MDSSSNYPDLLEKGMRKKKKRLAQGEISKYDPDKARKAESSAADQYFGEMRKKLRKGNPGAV